MREENFIVCLFRAEIINIFEHDKINHLLRFFIPGIASRRTNTHYASRDPKSIRQWHPVPQWQAGKKILAESRTLYNFLNGNAAGQ